jgi:hypothetical protein
MVDQLNCCWPSPAQSILIVNLVGQSVKRLLAFSSSTITGLSLLEIPDQNFYSLLGMKFFQNGASSLTMEGLVFLCRRSICCTPASAWVYLRCHSCHCTILSNIYTRHIQISCQCRLVQQVMPCLTKLLWNSRQSAERSQAWPQQSLSLLNFLSLTFPCAIECTFGFTRFTINSACVLHNLVIYSYT